MARSKASPYPREIDPDLAWSLVPPVYATLEEFIAAVRQYQVEIFGEDKWDAAAVVLPAPRVSIRPAFWDEAEEDGQNLMLELTAASAAGFTSGELLFQVHNAFVTQWYEMAGDHTFFEGFTRVKATEGQPLYDIDLGS
jgi:hypothetical protein